MVDGDTLTDLIILKSQNMGNNNSVLYWIIGIVAVVILGWFFLRSPSPTSTSQPSIQGEVTKIQFVNHLQAKLPEQDVFVQGAKTSEVMRVEGDPAAYLQKEAYAAASPVAHDPFKVGANPLGPFPKGKDLGFTLGAWLSATGSGTYTVKGNTAALSVSFQKLVPNGVYTVWCSRLTFPPNPKVVDHPCGAPDGSENRLAADQYGNGAFTLTMPPLEASTKETASVIALAYHSDGKTWGPVPGDFGLNSHVQLFFLVPSPESTSGQ